MRTIFRIVAFIALASLIASEIGARHFPSANYYLLPTRAWEILAGALCAVYVFGKQRPVNAALAIIGLGGIILSIFLFDPSTSIPSLAALLPVGGTALFLLSASAQNGAGRLLAAAPLVWIGRISFSAYLWHQPVFAFWRIRSPEPPTTLTMSGLIVLTLFLAALSWRFVEQPFRHRRGDLRKVVATVSACVIALAGFGVWGDLKEGLPFRLSPEVRSFVDRTTWSDACLFQVEDGLPTLPDPKCTFDVGTSKTYAVWGDSIIAAISPAIIDDLTKRNIGTVQLTHGFCAPISGVSIARDEGAANCDAFNERAMRYLLASNIDAVIMGGSWVNFFNARYMDIDGREVSGDGLTISVLAEKLRQTIDQLQAAGKRVVVVYPSPRFDKPVMDVMAEAIVKGDAKPDFEYSRADFRDNAERAYAVLDAALPQGVTRVFPEKIFCGDSPSASCFFGRDGVAYIADRGHFTNVGARMVAQDIMTALDGDAPSSAASR